MDQYPHARDIIAFLINVMARHQSAAIAPSRHSRGKIGELALLLNSKEQSQFWRELERVEQWLSTGAGTAAGRIYDTVGRPGASAFASYGTQLAAVGARVDRVRQALDQSAPVAKRLVMQQLSGIGLSAVWDILIAACKEIALYYGGSVVTGAVVGGAIGSLAFGAGAVPGAIAGTAAGSQVGIWVLSLLGLKELAEGLTKMFPAAMEHYERGFREAWGAVPDTRRDTWNSAAQPSGNALAGSWHLAQGHVILVTAILTALVAYLTRGRGNKAVLLQEIRESRRLGPKFADWLVENERRLINQPKLQTRPNNSVVMAMEGPAPAGGRGAAGAKSSAAADTPGANSKVVDGPRNVTFRRSDLSVKLDAETGEGAVYVKAAGETHTVGLISIVDGSPQFYLDNRVVTAAGESIKLKLQGGSLTKAALEDTISAYKTVYNKAPPNLSGSLADKNLKNFQNEFSRLRAQDFVRTDQTIADLAVRNISFGANRIDIGYGDLATKIGGFNSEGVPTKVFVHGSPSP